ncbi:hypothetical protein AMTRI_Chr10g6160 [Amborella trichopoda]
MSWVVALAVMIWRCPPLYETVIVYRFSVTHSGTILYKILKFFTITTNERQSPSLSCNSIVSLYNRFTELCNMFNRFYDFCDMVPALIFSL